MDLKTIVSQMTLEEKAGMCSGRDFWRLKTVERLGVPEVMMSDGPHGLRKQEEDVDHLGEEDSNVAVCFPAACATACSFDRALLRRLGETLGDECQAEGVSVLLGPAVNIKRSPLCGRNFEYFSEDPYLTGELAAAYIQGVQSRHVGTSIKHFAANNQETRRMSVSAEIDERTLREIYLAGFETAVKKAQPWTVMCSYNRINGVYSSENKKLLTDILRGEWGFDGYVVSDWAATDDRVEGLRAGLDLEMPAGTGDTDREIVEAVRSGRLEERVLDGAVERILRRVFEYWENRRGGEKQHEAHHAVSREIAERCAVLLKNEGGVLPLRRGAKAALIGLFAKEPRYQGGGSSHIHPYRVAGAAEWMPELPYAQGYTLDDSLDEARIAEAVALAQGCEVAVVFAGLPEPYESEGRDRAHMRLPENQNELIRRVAQAQPNTVVVLHNGSQVEMPWAGQVKGILELYLGGEAVGEAAARLLYGDANPSGKLAETLPLRLEDNPSYLNFPGDDRKVEYREGVFVGYRYYDTKKMAVQFPFGHGLSYTTFEYSGLRLSAAEIPEDGTLTVTLQVKNTGAVAGEEAVQLYVAPPACGVPRPEKELRGFEKVALAPGEEKTVSFTLGRRAFAYYSERMQGWAVAPGAYTVEIGASSRDIRLAQRVLVRAEPLPAGPVTQNTVLNDRPDLEKMAPVLEPFFRNLWETLHLPEARQAGERRWISSIPLRAMRSFYSLRSADLEKLVADLNAAVRKEGE